MTQKGQSVRGHRDLLNDRRGHGDLCGRFDLAYDPKVHGVIKGHCYLLYDPKGFVNFVVG